MPPVLAVLCVLIGLLFVVWPPVRGRLRKSPPPDLVEDNLRADRLLWVLLEDEDPEWLAEMGIEDPFRERRESEERRVEAERLQEYEVLQAQHRAIAVSAPTIGFLTTSLIRADRIDAGRITCHNYDFSGLMEIVEPDERLDAN